MPSLLRGSSQARDRAFSLTKRFQGAENGFAAQFRTGRLLRCAQATRRRLREQSDYIQPKVVIHAFLSSTSSLAPRRLSTQPSHENLIDNLARDIRETITPAVVEIGQSLVLHP